MSRLDRRIQQAGLPAIIVVGLGAWLSACTLGESGIRRGAGITHVQADFGIPEVISDRSGDMERFYLPASRPPEEWPWEAPRTFYYLDRDLQITFVNGRATHTDAIDQELKALVLMPLVEEKGDAR